MTTFADLSEEERYLYSILQDPSGIDLAEFAIFDPDADGEVWRAWPFQWGWWHCQDTQQIDQCVAEGSLVLTEKGHIPIEDIKVGDLVLTHRGRWRPVTCVWNRGEKEIVSVRGQGNPGLRVTPDHKLLARRSRRSSLPKDGNKKKKLLDVEWLSPEDWEWNDGSGIMHANWASPSLVDGFEGVPAMESTTHYRVKETQSLEWLWLYGLYIAEGSSFSDGHTHRVSWSLHKDEAEHVTRVLRSVGLRPYLDKRQNNCTVLCVNSVACQEWLDEHAKKLAHNKQLATWVYGLSRVQRQAVFDGLMFGDGHCCKGGYSYTTVSRKLSLDVKLLAQTLGYSASLYPGRVAGRRLIGGRTVNCRQVWKVDVLPLAEQKRAHTQQIDGLAWSPVTKVSSAGSAKVYDLEVEEDHSFIVEGVVVSNCARSVGKSLSISIRAFSFPFRFPGQEMVITAPELVHLEPITRLVERQMLSVRLTREMLPKSRSAITHRPFQMDLANGSRIIGRIPQRDGKGIKGCLGEGTLVLTSSGHVPVQDLRVGDLVLTHKGRWMPIEYMETDINDCYEVSDNDINLIVSCDHRFLIVEEDGESESFGDPWFADVETIGDIEAYWIFVDNELNPIFKKIQSVVPVGKRKVYNPIVAEDHSYVANSIVSHNTHPLILELDEGQDYPDPGWIELIETLKRGHDGAVWRVHGVTRGIRDYFYKFTQPGSGWKVHRIPAMARPTWTDQEREEKIENYGSRDAPDYRRNVLGLHGDQTNPLFVLSRLMDCVDIDETSDYNDKEYVIQKLTAEGVLDDGGNIVEQLNMPLYHLEMKTRWWMGMDVGFTIHPSVILIFSEFKPSKDKPAVLKLYAKYQLDRISHGDQVAVILSLIRNYKPIAFSMDRTGLGLPLFQDIQQQAPELADKIKGYNFSSKILVDFDQSIIVDEFRGDPVKDAGIERNVLEYASDKLRDLVDHKRLILPFDKDLIKEFQGQTWTANKSGMDQYGRKRLFSKGGFHALDAAKMAVLGWSQYGIEEMLKNKRPDDVYDVFVGFE